MAHIEEKNHSLGCQFLYLSQMLIYVAIDDSDMLWHQCGTYGCNFKGICQGLLCFGFKVGWICDKDPLVLIKTARLQ